MIACKCGKQYPDWLTPPIQCQCGESLDFHQKLRLGDKIEKTLGPLGKLYKRLHRKLTGKDCGCESRRERINRVGWRGVFGKD